MKPEENKFADVPIRVKTWIYIIIVFALGVSHHLAMTILVSWISFQCFFEFSRMFKIYDSPLAPSIFISVLQFFLLYFLNTDVYLLYSFLITILIVCRSVLKGSSVKQIYGISIALLICLIAFPNLLWIRNRFDGLNAIIFIVVVTELNDVFQYLMGKFFGKHKITPQISPNKTLEGLIGGIFITIILSNILGHFLLTTNMVTNSILGLVLGISGFFGDIFMSYVKRKTGVKDTGSLLPGHGGLLDRMDSLVFNAPLFFWLFPLLIKN
ncbi:MULTISPECIES: phosphatidate cytidylyltransferase [unclassified Chryseobacterium]|uniref:phosphatidate cytidylyltransferase n=1 Tax=unclassified Chryseobacterium TaxID=2593645 RepID=UPI0028535BD8|nr:phosphatidate cytidylyltransferase [Chryseobacterium sp. CFS7]MDR4893430.1 phosphatidate cytidylyltransferase [Chryseobacterium sp. CFS7]